MAGSISGPSPLSSLQPHVIPLLNLPQTTPKQYQLPTLTLQVFSSPVSSHHYLSSLLHLIFYKNFCSRIIISMKPLLSLTDNFHSALYSQEQSFIFQSNAHTLLLCEAREFLRMETMPLLCWDISQYMTKTQLIPGFSGSEKKKKSRRQSAFLQLSKLHFFYL